MIKQRRGGFDFQRKYHLLADKDGCLANSRSGWRCRLGVWTEHQKYLIYLEVAYERSCKAMEGLF